MLASLKHPSIVTLHDFGQAGDFFYLVMEFEDEFEISILDEDAEKIQTVGAAIEYIKSKS